MLFEISVRTADIPAHDDRVPTRFYMARVHHHLHVYFLRGGHDSEPIRPADVSSPRRVKREGEKQEKYQDNHVNITTPSRPLPPAPFCPPPPPPPP